jgi:hypothetical protein
LGWRTTKGPHTATSHHCLCDVVAIITVMAHRPLSSTSSRSPVLTKTDYTD